MDNLVPSTDQEVGVKKSKGQQNLRMFLFGLVGVILAALVLTTIVGVYRAYAKGATDKFTVTVAKILRLPVMKINGEVVRYSEYADDLKAIGIMRDYEKKNNGQNANLTDEQLTDQVLWRLANTILVRGGATAYGLKVEPADIDRLKTQLLQNFKSTDELDKELRLRYG